MAKSRKRSSARGREAANRPAVPADRVRDPVPPPAGPPRPTPQLPEPACCRRTVPPYPQILRGESYVWWRSVLGVVFGLSLFLLLTAVVSQALVHRCSGRSTAGDTPTPDYFREAFAFERPAGMLATNLGIATLIPICWVLMAIVHQVRPRWLSSVQPRIRWRYLLGCLVVAVVALNGVLLLSTPGSTARTGAFARSRASGASWW